MRNWKQNVTFTAISTRTETSVGGELWFVRDHQGAVPYLQADAGKVQPFFSSREQCEEWIMASSLEQHLAVVLQTRGEVAGFLQDIQPHYEFFTLDPPPPDEDEKAEARIAPVGAILEGFIVGFMP